MRSLPRLCALLLVVFSVPACAAKPEAEPSAQHEEALTSWRASYADLAKSRVPPTFDKVVSGVAAQGTGTTAAGGAATLVNGASWVSVSR